MSHTPTTLGLPAPPRNHRWQVASGTGGASSLLLVQLQQRRGWRWRTVDYSYIHPNPRDPAHTPARIAALMLHAQQARRMVGLA